MSDLISRLKKLRLAGLHNDVSKTLEKEYAESSHLAQILWENQITFWKDITLGPAVLTRRGVGDLEFMKELWSHESFIGLFNPLAGKLPDDDRLFAILEEEYVSPLSLKNQLHWVIRDRNRKPWGLLSLVDINLGQKRAEVLIGVLPTAPFALSIASMLGLYRFYFDFMGFNKLYSLVFSDNSHSLKSTLHIGFKQEGLLRKEVFNPQKREWVDLVRTGILRDEAFGLTNERLLRRLERNFSD